MRHKVLVIDDRIEGRSAIYSRLTKNYKHPSVEWPPSFDIELVFAQKPWEVESLLRRNVFSAIILDVVLDQWEWNKGHPVRASDMLKIIDDKTPVALLSAEWLNNEVKDLVAEWPTNNCRMFIHWDELENEQNVKQGSITRVLWGLSKHIEAYCNLDYSLTLEVDTPIRILHLSDMQFGGFDNWKLNLDANHCATTIRRLWPDGPTLMESQKSFHR